MCPLHGPVKGTVGRLAGEQTVVEGALLFRAPTGQVCWGFPVTKLTLQERLQHIHTNAETSKNPR